MTPYEISDLRSQLDQFMLGVVRLWLTAMFASFAVAYSLGKTLDVMSISVLLGFYAIIVLIVLQAMQSSFTRLAGLMNDAEALSIEPTPHSISRPGLAIPIAAKAGIMSAMAISYAVLCLYLYLAVR